MARRRITQEFEEITRNPPSYCKVGPCEHDLFNWEGYIIGPKNTPYEDGVFYIEIQYSPVHPFSPPQITFKTPIYHPNISSRGKICLDIIQDKWAPALYISSILYSIVSFLDDPDPNCGFNPSVENQYKYDRKTYDKTAYEWTQKYAMV